MSINNVISDSFLLFHYEWAMTHVTSPMFLATSDKTAERF